MSISRMGDKVFPVTVGMVTLVGCFVLLIRMMQTPEGDPIFDLEQDGEDSGAPHGLSTTLAWFAFLLALSSLLGFVLALAIFFVAFLRTRAAVSWTRTLVLSISAIVLNAESCLRLIRALAVEMHENWLEAHRYLNMDDLREHKKEALRMAA